MNKLIPFLSRFLRTKFEHRTGLLKIYNNISWLFFDKILRMGVGLLVGVWVARYLGPEQFGILNYAVAFVGLFSVIATLGLKEIIVRNIVKNPKEAQTMLETGFKLRILGGLIAFIMILGIMYILRPEDTLAKTIVAIYGFTLIFKATEVIKYWFESQVQSKFVVWIENGVFILIAGIKVGMILFNAPLISFAFAAFTETFLVASLLLIYFKRKVGNLITKYFLNFNLSKVLLSDSWPLILSGLAIAVYMKIDQIMLGQILGDHAVGIYSAAVRISEIWYFIPMIIVASVFPSIIQAKEKEEITYINKLQKVYNLMTLLALVVAIPMTFLSSWFVKILFGQNYSSSGPVLAIHIWAALFVFLGVASSRWFIIENRQILSFQRTFLGAFVNVVLNLLIIPKYGAIGAAYSTVISYSVAALFSDILQKETRPMFRMKLQSLNILKTIIEIRKNIQ